jgi:hypothetical protein
MIKTKTSTIALPMYLLWFYQLDVYRLALLTSLEGCLGCSPCFMEILSFRESELVVSGLAVFSENILPWWSNQTERH